VKSKPGERDRRSAAEESAAGYGAEAHSGQAADGEKRRGPRAAWFVVLGLAAAAGLLAEYPLQALGILALCAAVWMGAAAVAHVEWMAVLLCFAVYTRLSDVICRHIDSSVLSPDKALVLIIAGALMVRWLLYRKRPEGCLPAFVFLGAYGAASALSIVGAADSAGARGALVEYVKNAFIALLMVAVIRRGDALRSVVWAILMAGAFMGTLTVFQFLTHTFDHSYWGFSMAPQMQIVGEVGGNRVSGPVGDPNFFAQVMLAPVPLALERFGNERRLLLKALAVLVLGVCVLSIILTFSRGGFLALVLMGALAVVRLRHTRLALPLIAAVVALALVMMPAEYGRRIMTLVAAAQGAGSHVTTESSFRGRASEILSGCMMFVDHPVTGVGLSNYSYHYQEYARRLRLEKRLAARTPHSLYLEVLAESGVVGFAAFALLIGAAFRALRQACRRMRDAGAQGNADMGEALTAGLFGYLVAALFLHGAYPSYLWLLVGIAFAFRQVAANDCSAATERHEPENPAGRTEAMAPAVERA
jgi:putative inorganic carbon (HCO3(-)) transporter